MTLRADVYRPAGSGRFPALLQRTPYGRGQWPVTALTLDPVRAAISGYVVIIQDVRGRGESEGASFFPYRDEARDGFDSVEWASRLEACDGRVAAYGVSYMGGAAWHAASEAPPALCAIATATAPNDFWSNHLWRGGAFLLGTFVSWSLGVIGPIAVLRSRQRGANVVERLRKLVDAVDDFEHLVWRRPSARLAALCLEDGSELPFFEETMVRVEPDDLTSRLSVSERHARVRVPALIVAGWHDFLLEADLEHYSAMRTTAGTERARRATRLVIGPWSHGSFLPTVGQQDFGIRAGGFWRDLREDLTGMHLGWFARQFDATSPSAQGAGAEPPSGGADSRVEIFVQGIDRWRSFDSWPPPATPLEWYLGPRGTLTASEPVDEHSPHEFVYDPEDPCPTCGGSLLMPRTYLPGPVDQAPILNRSDVLAYTSDPLPDSITVVGRVSAVLYCATSAPDTDWVVKLCRVEENGRTMNVCDGVLRASFRCGVRRRTPVEPGRVERYTVQLSSTAVRFRAGTRLRVLVTSSDFPRYDRNPNTGEPGVLATRSVPARQAVGCDVRYPSRVTLPVLDAL